MRFRGGWADRGRRVVWRLVIRIAFGVAVSGCCIFRGGSRVVGRLWRVDVDDGIFLSLSPLFHSFSFLAMTLTSLLLWSIDLSYRF